MERTKVEKLLPDLGADEKRVQIIVGGQPVTADYVLHDAVQHERDGDAVSLMGLWDELGGDLLQGESENWPKRNPAVRALEREACRAIAADICAERDEEEVGYEGWIGGIDFCGNSHQMGIMRRAA